MGKPTKAAVNAPAKYIFCLKNLPEPNSKKVLQFAVSTRTKFGGAATGARYLERTILEASGNSEFLRDFLLSWMP